MIRLRARLRRSPAAAPTSDVTAGAGPRDITSGAGTPGAAAPGAGADFDRRLFPPMILGSILNPINSSMIAVALVPIGIAFGAPPAQTAWLVSALYLATAVGQPVVGRLVDRYGPRRLYLIGTALVGVAGVAGALAPSLGVLIAARALLGLGTCAGYPAAMHLIRTEARRTGRDSPAGVLTVLSIATQTISVIGPTLGGLLIAVGGWRTIFAVNIPLSIAALILGALRLPRRAPARSSREGFDVTGIALFTATLTALLLFGMNPAADRWYLPVAAALAVAGLVLRETRVAVPFLDLRVLASNPALLATYGRTLLSYVVSYSFIYGYTQWLEQGRGLSAAGAGLILLPVFLTGIIVASLTGRRAEVRGKLVVGSAAQIISCAMLLLLHSGSPIWLLVGVSMIVGIPQGLNSLANQSALYHQADPARIGSAAGLLRTFMYLGAMVASAATGGFFGPRADTHGLSELATFTLVVAVLFLVVTLADRSLRRIGAAPSAGTAAAAGTPATATHVTAGPPGSR